MGLALSAAEEGEGGEELEGGGELHFEAEGVRKVSWRKGASYFRLRIVSWKFGWLCIVVVVWMLELLIMMVKGGSKRGLYTSDSLHSIAHFPGCVHQNVIRFSRSID